LLGENSKGKALQSRHPGASMQADHVKKLEARGRGHSQEKRARRPDWSGTQIRQPSSGQDETAARALPARAELADCAPQKIRGLTGCTPGKWRLDERLKTHLEGNYGRPNTTLIDKKSAGSCAD